MKKREIELVTAMLDMQYDLAKAEAKIEALERYAQTDYAYIPDEIAVIFDLPKKAEKKPKKKPETKYWVEMPEESVPY